MLYAKKGNKVVEIDERMKAHYLNDGFTIYKDGKPVEYGKGVGPSMAEFNRLKEENAALKARIEELEAAVDIAPVGTVSADEDAEARETTSKSRRKK